MKYKLMWWSVLTFVIVIMTLTSVVTLVDNWCLINDYTTLKRSEIFYIDKKYSGDIIKYRNTRTNKTYLMKVNSTLYSKSIIGKKQKFDLTKEDIYRLDKDRGYKSEFSEPVSDGKALIIFLGPPFVIMLSIIGSKDKIIRFICSAISCIEFTIILILC